MWPCTRECFPELGTSRVVASSSLLSVSILPAMNSVTCDIGGLMPGNQSLQLSVQSFSFMSKQAYNYRVDLPKACSIDIVFL